MTAASIRKDSPQHDAVTRLLEDYIKASRAAWPAHEDYVLDREELMDDAVTFWTARLDGRIVGCIALKLLDDSRAEIKSLCVDSAVRGEGIGKQLVSAVIDEARDRNLDALLLETGSMPFYAAARRLYADFGFEPCGVFGEYRDDLASCFMRLEL
ncbi:MAG: GNAT family N-acetyltransferase [Gammaproteobacteria bacterium]|nr:GNAT family N-acetyltransferase [Gammaproteobacteria bacterium]